MFWKHSEYDERPAENWRKLEIPAITFKNWELFTHFSKVLYRTAVIF